jgi:2-C-methyl-D-erythritol 4-phosphate cytidylyltransferase/2-C-methyl-D-erythritol 2,4-cyclodiphosphate synthase
MPDAVAVVLAAGSGERLGSSAPKAFIGVRGRPMLAYAAGAALACHGIAWVVAAVPPGFEDLAHATLEPIGSHAVVTGGSSRQASVRAALAAIPEDAPVIVCHDAARPFASAVLFRAVLDALDDADGAVPVVPVSDTMKRVRGGLVVATEPREDLASAQTPQAFRAPALRDAHARALEANLEFTDDAAALEWAGYRVRAVPGEEGNFKITTAADLARAERAAPEVARG